jgi:hypothetical protein
VVALVLVLSSSGGGKSTGNGSSAGQSAGKTVSTSGGTGRHTPGQTSSHHSESSAASAASPANTSVTVLNGTSTAGLAHRLSTNLQQSGYSRAKALNGSPPGSHANTIVEYTNGHRADAQGVASSLGVAQVQPMETGVASLAGAASVVVLAGADKAAAVGETPGGSGASSATGQ